MKARKRFHVNIYSKKYKFTKGYYRTNNLLLIIWLKIKSIFKGDRCLIYDLKKGNYI